MIDKNIWKGWEILEQIGAGGFSKVYKMRKLDDDEDYYSALKIVSIPQDSGEYNRYISDGYDHESITSIFKSQADRIISEFKLMRKFRGTANIVNYEDHHIIERPDTHGWDILIRMELLTSIPDYYINHPFDENTTVKLGTDICNALMLCEKENIVHRDIKPQNIFVNDFGDFKLGDFGIARVMDHATHATRVGTPTYIAPEVYNGNKCDNRADIYCLGMVLYWLLNERRLPFLPLPPAAPTSTEIESANMRRLIGEPLPEPKNGTSALKKAVMKALAFNPAERFATAAEFKAALTKKEAVIVPPVGDKEDTVIVNKAETQQAREKTQKKSKKGLLFVILGLVLLVAAGITAVALMLNDSPDDSQSSSTPQTVIDNSISWQLKNGTLTISGNGAMDNYSYDSNNDWRSRKAEISSVIIEDGVTSIGEYAFSGCSSLTSISIPDSVTSIGDWAFYRCSSLTSISIPDSVTSIGYRAFKNTGYYNNASNWENNVLYIGKHLIDANSYREGDYTIKPDTLCIADYAFEDCSSLTSISIPDSVTSIGDRVFAYCDALTHINVSGDNLYYCDVDGILFNKDKTELLCFPEGNTASNYTIEDSVTSIGEGAFYRCSSLTSISIPDSVTSIGECAFSYCSSLTSISIPDSVTSIGDWAFCSCYSLTSISIPDSVTSIGEGAFSFCSSLTSISIPDSVTSIGDRAFSGCSSLTSISIPDSVTSIGEIAFYSCSSLTSISIPDSVTSIGESAFSDCYSLTSISIPDSVTSIGNYAFSDCDSLETVYYSGTEAQWSDIDIDESNMSLTNANIIYNGESADTPTPEGVSWRLEDGTLTISGNGAMDNYSYGSNNDWRSRKAEITSVIIEDGVTSIGNYAFSGCSSLTSITIPDSVTSIGFGAFYNCSSLTSISIPDSVTSIGDWAFSGCSSLTSISIPDSVTSIGEYAFYYCNSLTSISIPDSVTSIGEYAFYYCSSLTSITIGGSVTSIGNYAFEDCDSLETVYYSGTKEQWNKMNIGYGNSNLTDANIVYNYQG